MFLTQNGDVISTNGRRILISKATSLRSLAVLPAVACLLAASSAFAQAPNNNEGLGNKADKVLVSFTDTGLTEAQQNAQGLLVPLNNDWDDASRTAATATPPSAKKPDWDNDELKTEDNEVLTAKLSFKANPAAAGNEKIVTEHGKWYLTYPAERLAVWWVAPGQTAWSRLATGTEVPVDSLAAGVTVNLKIEGKGVSAAFKADSITASFKFTEDGDDIVDGSSKLDVTVFQADLKIAGTDDLNEDNPGACAFLNDSQDEGNKESAATDAKTLRDNQPDFAAGHRIKLTPTPDPDIEDVEINVLPKDLKGKWSLKYTNTALLFWKEDGTAQIASETDSAEFTVPATGTFQVKLKLEAIKKEKTTATLTFKPTDYPKTFDDPVVVDVAQVDLDSDSDRSGDVEGNDAEDDIETDEIGSIILVNCDDDDGNHQEDSNDDVINGTDDVADLGKLMLRKLPGTLPENAEVRLIADSNFKIFKGREATSTKLVPATGTGYVANTYIIPRADILAGDITLGIEGVNFPPYNQKGKYELALEVKVGSKVHRDPLAVRLAPYIMLPNTQNAQKLFVGTVDSAMNTAIHTIVGGKVSDVNTNNYKEGTPPFPDRWLQDEVEIGYAKAPYGKMHVVLDLPRNRGLDLSATQSWPGRELLSPNVGLLQQDGPEQVDAYDYGGDLEVSGPVTVGGKNYKFGRIVVGDGMGNELKKRLAVQGVQSAGDDITDIVTCDTYWLGVGHVDEVISFLPTGGNNFKVLIADTPMAVDLARKMSKSVSGTAATASTTGLTVTGATWVTDAYKDGFIRISAGAHAGQVRRILTNSGNSVTIVGTWGVTAGESFRMWPRTAFATLFYGDGGIAGEDKEAVGVATGSGTRTLTDSIQNWVPNEFAKSTTDEPSMLQIVAGAGRGKFYEVVSNTNNTITVDRDWDVPLGPDSVYVVVQHSKKWENGTIAFGTVGSFQDPMSNANFLAFNQLVQDKIDTIKADLIAGLGLTDADFIKIPAIFDGSKDPAGDIYDVGAWMPGMVNLQVTDGNLLVPKPFGARSATGDVFEAAMRDQITGTGQTANFIDDWKNYHIKLGQIHCGTNAIRDIPDLKWWE